METEPQWLLPLEREQLLLSLVSSVIPGSWVAAVVLAGGVPCRCCTSAGSSGAVKTLLFVPGCCVAFIDRAP